MSKEEEIKTTAAEVQVFLVKKSVELGRKQGISDFKKLLIAEIEKEISVNEKNACDSCWNQSARRAIEIIKTLKQE